MARKMTEWPSKRGPISKIWSSDGCRREAVPLAVERWYDFPEFGDYLGNVGLLATTAASAPGRYRQLMPTRPNYPAPIGLDQHQMFMLCFHLNQ